jgi:diguanylate cyclase (GGDEF)-like protein/PAS domain S-box-containing protein
MNATPRQRWSSPSIASRITAATALLIGCMVLAMAGLAFVNARSLVLRNVDDALNGSARQLADRVSQKVTAIDSSVAGLAANALVVNALLDSSGRSAYLQPFLRDLALPGKVRGTMTLTDHRGMALATNDTARSPSYADADWLPGLMNRQQPAARLSHGPQPTLLLAYPVVLPSTLMSEGALVLEISLTPMFQSAATNLPDGMSASLQSNGRLLAQGGADTGDMAGRADTVAVRAPVAADGAIGALGLEVDVAVPRSTALQGIGELTRDIVVAGLAALLLGSGMARYGAARLMRPLNELSRVVDRIRRERRLDLKVPESGDDEIGTMAASFNDMVQTLRQAQENLEAQVSSRTAALERTRARLDAVQRQMNDGLLVVDANGCIESFSGGAERLFDCAASAVVGRGVAVLIPSWNSAVAEASLDVSANGRFQRKVRALRGQQAFAAEISVSLMVVDKLPQWVVLVRDVTDQQDTEQRLRASNEQLNDSLARLQRHDDDMGQVNRMNELLASCQSSAEAHAVIERVLGQLFAGHAGALAVHRAAAATLDTVARWGDPDLCLPSFALTDCWGLRLGRRHDTNDAAAPLCEHTHPETRGVVCLPLSVQGETLGLLMSRTSAEASGDEHRRLHHLMAVVGEAVKFGLSNLQLRDALRSAALRDTLTGLYNRRYLNEVLPQDLARAQRTAKPLAVAVIDLDHFKRFNDGYGHEAGDLVLKETARLLCEALRGSDIMCRLGGEELVAVLRDSTAADAAARLDKFRAALGALSLDYRGAVLPPVTASIGVAQATLHGRTMEALLRAADEALYQAKAQGRNRTVLAGNPPGLQAVTG